MRFSTPKRLPWELAYFAALPLGCVNREYNAPGADVMAAFNTSVPRGRETVRYRSPAGIEEICLLPNHFSGVHYKEDDARDETRLCSLNFHKPPAASDAGEAVALCPKMSSTFPGVEVYELKGQDKESYERQLCANQENRPTDRLAKFKQSVSCSYTGSILGYYHLSRILGGAGNVPPAVVRTMDVAAHSAIAARGVAWSSDLNQQLWRQVARLDGGNRAESNFFTADRKAVFGALSRNPKGEERYSEINRNSADGATALRMFLSSAPVARVLDGRGAGALVGRPFTEAAPVLQQMRDISDMMLMDFIFQQQDRFGNIHYQDYWFWMGDDGQIKDKRIKRDDAGNIETPQPSPGAVVVKKMMLKDNDCGSRADNPKAFTLAHMKSIRHMHPRTYMGLQTLAAKWREGSAPAFFESEALLNTDDAFGREGIADFGKRLEAVAGSLKAACETGSLLLDLSIEEHVSSANTVEAGKARCSALLSGTDADDHFEARPVDGTCKTLATLGMPSLYGDASKENPMVSFPTGVVLANLRSEAVGDFLELTSPVNGVERGFVERRSLVCLDAEKICLKMKSVAGALLRKGPGEGEAAIVSFPAFVSLAVREKKGDWLRVAAPADGVPDAWVRKEGATCE